MRVFDNSGHVLGSLPADAVRVQSSLLMLSGKYVDSDGIIYDPDGSINEPATAAYAREVAAGRVASAYPDYAPTSAEVKAESVQEKSAQDANSMYWDAMTSNVFTTAQEIPGRLVDAATTGVKSAFDIGKWIVIGLVAYAIIKVADRVPSRGHVKRYAQKQFKSVRRRVARQLAGD